VVTLGLRVDSGCSKNHVLGGGSESGDPLREETIIRGTPYTKCPWCDQYFQPYSVDGGSNAADSLRQFVSLTPNSHRQARHDRTVLSVSRLPRRCDLDSRRLTTVDDRKFEVWTR